MKKKGSRNIKGVSRIINVQGYYEVFEPNHPLAKRNGYVREHRMIAWNAGILTNKSHVVHHKNGDKLDNRIENLEAIDNGEHTRMHWAGTKRAEWTKERRAAHSELMKGNKNWKGNKTPQP